MFNKKKIRNYSFLSFVLAGVYFYQNKVVKKTVYKIKDRKIKKQFNNFKIIHLSDIHCQKIGFSDMIFFENIKKESPDIIVITGDLLDSYKNNSAIAYNILIKLREIAPCYYVSGNHELRLIDEYKELNKMFKKIGICNLSNSNVLLKKEGEEIVLSGVEDLKYFYLKDNLNYYALFRNSLIENYNKDRFNILLTHRPEKIHLYSDIGYDLVFAGHAHGGQWNLPFLGRIFSPSQGFFPKYTHGIYKEKQTRMIVSQGLGNSSFPIRINNRLEYIVVTLHTL